MEGVAYRRDLVPRRALRRHFHAGERAAWLATAARQGPYADERLSLENAVALLVWRRKVARHVRGGGGDPVAVRFEGGPDRETAPRMRRSARQGQLCRVSPERLCSGRRLRGWLHPADPPDGCLRAPGPACGQG